MSGSTLAQVKVLTFIELCIVGIHWNMSCRYILVYLGIASSKPPIFTQKICSGAHVTKASFDYSISGSVDSFFYFFFFLSWLVDYVFFCTYGLRLFYFIFFFFFLLCGIYSNDILFKPLVILSKAVKFAHHENMPTYIMLTPFNPTFI